MFGTDTTVKLGQQVGGTGLGCTSEQPYGLKITASGKTLDLNKFKIVGVRRARQRGHPRQQCRRRDHHRRRHGAASSGIEIFDWCVKDEGQSPRLTVTNLRCFRARTAGIDITSKKASITDVTRRQGGRHRAPPHAECRRGESGSGRGGTAPSSRTRSSGGRATIGIWVGGHGPRRQWTRRLDRGRQGIAARRRRGRRC